MSDFNDQQRRFFRILNGMEVHFTPEQEAQIGQIATKAGTDTERLVKEYSANFIPSSPIRGASKIRALLRLHSPQCPGWPLFFMCCRFRSTALGSAPPRTSQAMR